MIKFGLLGLVISAIYVWVRTERGLVTARSAEARGGCVACGSLKLDRHADRVTCAGCGYEGRADGGGALRPGEVGSVFSKRTE